MTGYEDRQCRACGRIGQNTIEELENTIGDKTYSVSKWLICKCGEELFEIIDEEDEDDE